MEIRKACPGDEEAIARVHVASWESTYRGLFPDALLDDHDLDERVKLWTRVLKIRKSLDYVAVDENAGIVGFVSGGPNREPEEFPEYAVELYAIYILSEFQKQGIGRALTQVLVRDFLSLSFQSMMLWVARGNSAQHFYEAIGGQKLREEAKEFRGYKLDHVAYGWPDISVLIECD